MSISTHAPNGACATLTALRHGCPGFEHSQQFNGHISCRGLALLQADLLAHLPTKGLATLLAKATRQMNLVTGANERRERRHIPIHHRGHYVGENKVESSQSLVNGGHLLAPSTPLP